jgi:hypothetical protein
VAAVGVNGISTVASAKSTVSGTAASEQARQSGAGARPLAELGWKFAQAAPR